MCLEESMSEVSSLECLKLKKADQTCTTTFEQSLVI